MPQNASSPSPRSFHYAWVIAALTFVTLLVAAGIRATAGVLIVPFEQEFGWTRATISFAISVNLLLYGLLGPFAAMLIDRLGLRRVMVGAMSILVLGVAATTLVNAVWQMVLLWGIVVGCGSGIVSVVLGTMVVERWFMARRGLLLGILTASTATGQLLFLPILAAIVDRFGWRAAVLTIAAAGLLLIPLLVVLMRDRPADLNLRAYGDHREIVEATPAAVKTVGATIAALWQGLRSRDFWLLSLSFFVCGASTNGLIGTHLIPACVDHGISEVQGASLLAFMGMFDLVGTTASGWLTDRWNSRYLLFWYYGLRGLALLYLPFAFHTDLHGLPLFAVFYGLDWIATVPPTVRLTADAFGKARVGVMFGWIIASHQIGAAVAAFGAGASRTWLGSYTQAFMVSGGLCLIAAMLVLQIGRRARSLPTAEA